EESRILHNLLRFSSLRVRDVMTPRTVVVTLPQDQTVGEVIESHDSFRFSRLPVHAENREDITGFVLKDDILLRAAQEHYDEPLEALRRDLEVVPESLPLLDLFERLLDQSAHIALVVDEYGGMAGIVTLEDVVETLLGLEIVDEVDSVDDMQKLAREQWRKRAERLGIVPEEMKANDTDLLRRDTSGDPSTGEEPAEASTAAGTSSMASSSPSDQS
ncbi:MAG: CBS domain-containing protein, partial [Bacteroidetes bacterium]|nr:CBS domain-containing protein [Bacteroidota bacterium]